MLVFVRCVATVLVAGLVLGSGALPSTTAASVATAVDSTYFDAMLRRAQTTFRIPALSVAVVEGDDTTYAQGFGQSDESGGAVRPDSPFVIGSVS